MPFEEVETKKKSAHIIEQIVKAIQTGEYKAGEKLPPEREIAQETKVSRTSVREAFVTLRLAGIIETRSGDGTYVKESGNWANRKTQALTILQKDEDPYVTWEAREAIELGVVKLAVKNVTGKDIRKVKESLERMRKSVDNKDYIEYFESDRDFHLAIAEATHNPLIKQTVQSLVNIMNQRLWREIKQKYFLEGEGNIEESFANHQNIFRALKDRNPEKVMKSLLDHFNELKDHLGQP